jgi:hypothetical protein
MLITVRAPDQSGKAFYASIETSMVTSIKPMGTYNQIFLVNGDVINSIEPINDLVEKVNYARAEWEKIRRT